MRNIMSIIIIIPLLFCKIENQSNIDTTAIFQNLGLMTHRNNRLTISGTAVKGIVKNAKITINSIAPDGSCDASKVLASSNTDLEGAYSLSYNKTGNMVCLTVSSQPNGKTTVYDEKIKADVSIPLDSDFKLVTLLPESRIIQNSRKNTQASPFSSMLMKRFQYLIKEFGPNADTNQIYKKASKEIVIRFGLNTGFSNIKPALLSKSPNISSSISDSDYIELDDIPIDLNKPNDPVTVKYIALLSGFSQLANQYKTGPEVSVKDISLVVNSFATDFEDGIFDGKGADNKPITIGEGPNQVTFSSTPLTTVLLPAVVTYIREGGTLNVGAPTSIPPATITPTQAVDQIQFVDNANITSVIVINPSNPAPTNLTFPGNPFTFTNGAPITTITPTVTGTITNCVVTPALPTGLSLNSTTCAISGTPTVNQVATSYIIIASNSGGNTTATVSITVNNAAPTNLTYAGNPYIFTNGSAITNVTPTVTGTVTSCTVNPVLPTGLSLNTTTCAISGTPTMNQTATSHTITASNNGGNTTATISITVNFAAPTNLVYTGGPFTYTKNIAISSVTPTVTGTVTNCVATPVLPSGLILNLTTCAISGTPTAIQGATNHTITASNNGGSTNAIVNITVYPPFRLPDAGQTTCYNDTTSITCGASHQGQDADYANTPFAISFTGPTAHATYTSDYTTTDNTTGFVWKTCTEGLSGATCATGSISYLTNANSVTACNNLNSANSGAGYAGRTNWHLASIQELLTIPNFSITGTPKIDTAKFPGSQPSDFWASTPNGGNFWELFNDGTSSYGTGGGLLGARCVSGSGVPAQSFTDNGNGSITDNNTGLIWQKCGMGANNDATCSGTLTGAGISGLSYCEGLTLAGRSDWRLPNVREFQTIIDYTVTPKINATYFPSGSSNFITSTTLQSTPANNYYIDFSNGTINNDSPKTAAFKVRCVAEPF